MAKNPDVRRAIGEADTAGSQGGTPTFIAGMQLDNYELIRELGRGGMGTVFLARDIKLGRRVAIKFLHTASHEMTERFLAEARTTARVSHENIVVIHEVGEHKGVPHMVLEHLEGTQLRELMTGRVAASRAVSLIVPVVRAVVRAHAAGVVHRDLKPENIFVTVDGAVKVLDFGIAKALQSQDTRTGVDASAVAAMTAGPLTSTGVIIGTPQYMAPEQFLGSVDHRSDVWAIGIMLFELLTGAHPLAPYTTASLMAEAMQFDTPMPRVSSVIGDVPDALDRIVDRCLQKLRDDRYPTSAELLSDLEAIAPPRRGRPLAPDESPYPGLTAFQEADADRFFGRSRDIARMLARLRDHPLVGIAGPSGVGKSSFVRAGVVPELKAGGEAWDAIVVRPGRHPFASLASALAPVGDRDTIARRLREEHGALGTLLRERAARKNAKILLFVDQFEETYTLVADAAERQAFGASLAAAADDASTPVRVVLAIRSDFLDRAGEDRAFLDELTRGLVFLQPMGRPELCEALARPLDLLGYDFETDQLIERMLDDLAGTSGALPLLQFTAARLWQARDRKSKQLTAAAYAEIGGVGGALATHADQVLAAMPSDRRPLVREVFRRLVTPERTRAVVEVADVLAIAPDGVQHVIDQLVEARLLVVQTDGTVEIVHESLIAGWPQLQRWLDEDREDAVMIQQLAAAAKQWQARAQSPDLLWRGDVLDDARRWHAQRTRQLAAREQAFFDASLGAARRSARTRRLAIGAVITVLALVAGLASIAYVRVRAAEQTAQTALTAQRREALARREADDRRTAALAALLSEEQLRKAAESGLLTAEQVAEIAEAQRRVAESQRITAEQLRAMAEQRRARMEQDLKTAEAERFAAQQAAQKHAVEAALTREQLVAKNAELEQALAAAKAAQDRAQAALSDAERAKAQAQKSFESEKARAERLERERKKITTDLK